MDDAIVSRIGTAQERDAWQVAADGPDGEIGGLGGEPNDLTVPLDGRRTVRLQEVDYLARGDGTFRLHVEGVSRIADAHATVTRLFTEGRRVYGITTGFGPLAGYRITPDQSPALQRKLIHHLASGVGAPLPRTMVRAAMASRVVTLARGHSGVAPATLRALLDCLDRDVTPVVPSQGTVGASGDLTPLAHVALTLMGEGHATLAGQRMPASAALNRAGLNPIDLGAKDGLALVNGTSMMTGIAAMNGTEARLLTELALAVGAAAAEVLGGHAEAWDQRLGMVRPHAGQAWAHTLLTTWMADSARLAPAPARPPLLSESSPSSGPGPLPQDVYSARCLPQIIGAVLDQIDHHDKVAEIELNSVTDNPIVFTDDQTVLHGGNFHGQPVALASDALSNAIITVACLLERVVARLCDPRKNNGLPACLTGGTPGLDSGFMGAQVTASALLAEMRTRAVPASIQSISTNNDNQDMVPMGTIGARNAARHLEDLRSLLAITVLAVAQAADLRGAALSEMSSSLTGWARALVPGLGEDRPMSDDIRTVADALAARRLPVIAGL